jgi:ubiquinone/menaquinone biosynthesis C-methylase UbiE
MMEKIKILDIGCGIDKFEINDPECSIIGLDVSRKSHADVLGDATKLPFKDNSFEKILAIQLIEHLIEYEQFVEECSRVLKKDGMIHLETPNKKSLFNMIFRTYYKKGLQKYDDSNIHRKIFCEEELIRLLKKNKLSIEKSNTVPFQFGLYIYNFTVIPRKILCFLLPRKLRENIVIECRKE